MRMVMARNPVRAAATVGASPLRKTRQSPKSPRTSPGLLAGHYAGCKFSEPPSPSTLPLPPLHWTLQRQAELPCGLLETERDDSSLQLKMLLKIEA